MVSKSDDFPNTSYFYITILEIPKIDMFIWGVLSKVLRPKCEFKYYTKMKTLDKRRPNQFRNITMAVTSDADFHEQFFSWKLSGKCLKLGCIVVMYTIILNMYFF